MKSGIGRFASFAVLSLAVAAQALAADGPDMQRQGASSANAAGGQSPMTRQGPARAIGNGHTSSPQNPGGQWQGHPPGNNGGQWQGRPPGNNSGQWQGHPQGGNGGQWQGRPPGNNGGQWQGRPPGGNDHPGASRPSSDAGRQWQGRPIGGGSTSQWQGNNSAWQGGNRPPPGGWQGHPPPNHGNWGPHPSYWRPGYVTSSMPAGHYRVPYRGSDYYFNDGYWYRPYGSRYVVVTPPYGVRVRYLPSYAEQVWIGSIGYFLVAGTYYLWQAGTQEYEVVAPPQQQPEAVAQTPYDVVAYPMYNQGPDQQARDRYECHGWAVQQSGFDPASASYAPPADVADNYRRALGACLGGRGYSVN